MKETIENLNALAEARDALSSGNPYEQYLAERIEDRLHDDFVDAWFTGELDDTPAPLLVRNLMATPDPHGSSEKAKPAHLSDSEESGSGPDNV